jgi:hypothetical protein
MQMIRITGNKRWFLLCGLFLVLASCGGDDDESAQAGAGECSGCHTAQAAAWQNFSSHKGIYKTCAFCHEKATQEPGEGHRSSPWCDQCHSEHRHPPERILDDDGLLFFTCMTCHNPMGSKNIYLIREKILVEPGKRVPVDFHNIEGRADDSYAECGTEDGGLNGKEAGSGLCEVCHAKTSAYNNTGTGRGHYRSRCAACHDHAIAFGVEPTCIMCHNEEVDNVYDSLHTTRRGMETWYIAENGGFEALTGVPYDALACKNCHRSDQPDWKEPNCRDCHATGEQSAPDDTCLKCHGRQAAEINKHQLTDVHRDAGMGCVNCHDFVDIHGDGTQYDSMFDPGAIDARCEDCHDSLESNAYHDLHDETVDCSACHTQTVVSCYNCHFDSEVNGTGKVAYGQFKNWKFLLNRDGKVYPGNIQSLKYGRIEDGTDATFVVIAPYYSHSVAKKAVDCDDCHGSALVNEYLSTGAIQAVKWNGISQKLEHATGIIPVPPDYTTSLKFDFVDWDGVTKDQNDKPVWTFFKSTTDAFQMIEEYGAPLTNGQIQKLTD